MIAVVSENSKNSSHKGYSEKWSEQSSFPPHILVKYIAITRKLII